MTTKIDPTTFKTGDIVHVRGKIVNCECGGEIINVDFDGEASPIGPYEIVAHFPAIRSWSEIEGNLTEVFSKHKLDLIAPELRADIIALLNEIDPKEDA